MRKERSQRSIPLHNCYGKAHVKPQCKAENNLGQTSWNLERCHTAESRLELTERKTKIILL